MTGVQTCALPIYGSYGYGANGGNYDNLSHYSVSSSMGIAEANSRQGFRVVIYFK